ncbi:MAG: glycyl-radical enzyme activating protein [Bacteroidetes bacterium]|nr:glycyl-radical enzyme activating protein [Bacteroidota bacterium]
MVLVFDIRRFSVHDGPGIRTTIFLKGCPLHCLWCHNPESRQTVPEKYTRKNRVGNRVFEVEEQIGKYWNTDSLMKEILRDGPFFEESGGGVTFSGGEPLMQAGPLKEILRECRKQGVHTAVDTCGFAPEKDFREVAALCDLFLFDLKYADPAKHLEYTGVSNDIILSNLYSLKYQTASLIIRIPIIPSVNDGQENLDNSIEILNKLKDKIIQVDLLPYHTLGNHKYTDIYPESEKAEFPLLEVNILNHWMLTLIKEGFVVTSGG